MTREEASVRKAAAIERINAVRPLVTVVCFGIDMVSAFLRSVLHVCIGAGAADLLGLGWWAIPIAAALSMATIGTAWTWWRRDARVRAWETAADVVERGAAS